MLINIKSLDPFDDSAPTRLARMGITTADGKPNTDTMPVFAGIFSALFYERAMDYYDNPHLVDKISEEFSSMDSSSEHEQMFILLCLQYDALREPLPDPVWWLAGNAEVVREFMRLFAERLSELVTQEREGDP